MNKSFPNHAPVAAQRRRLAAALLSMSAFAAWGLLAPSAAHAAPRSDIDAIRHVLMHTFDKPEARLKVDPVVVRGAWGIADWQQAERGGRALMRRADDGKSWEINLCSGDGLKHAKMLQETGMSPAEAQALAAALAKAEARLDAATLARLASFEGTVRMGAHGEHPPVDGQGHAGHGEHGGHAGHHGGASDAK